jgi:hypothetical protein
MSVPNTTPPPNKISAGMCGFIMFVQCTNRMLRSAQWLNSLNCTICFPISQDYIQHSSVINWPPESGSMTLQYGSADLDL